MFYPTHKNGGNYKIEFIEFICGGSRTFFCPIWTMWLILDDGAAACIVEISIIPSDNSCILSVPFGQFSSLFTGCNSSNSNWSQSWCFFHMGQLQSCYSSFLFWFHCGSSSVFVQTQLAHPDTELLMFAITKTFHSNSIFFCALGTLSSFCLAGHVMWDRWHLISNKSSVVISLYFASRTGYQNIPYISVSANKPPCGMLPAAKLTSVLLIM